MLRPGVLDQGQIKWGQVDLCLCQAGPRRGRCCGGMSSCPIGPPRTEPTGKSGLRYAFIAFLGLEDWAQLTSLIHLLSTPWVICLETKLSLFPSEATNFGGVLQPYCPSVFYLWIGNSNTYLVAWPLEFNKLSSVKFPGNEILAKS